MSTTTIQYRKRSIDSLSGDSPIDNKRPRRTVYFRLESESPAESNDDTESVYSIQGKETDRVKDTSDTDSNSNSATEYEVEIEYDIESLSDDKESSFSCSSSGNEDVVLATAAVVCDSSLDAFITDAEDSDNSRQDDSSSGLRDFWTCVQCKSHNDNPQYRFCHKCFQDRKMFFPPRPRRHKKAKRNKEKSHPPVKLNADKFDAGKFLSYLNGIAQDSGIGSSQEFTTNLCLDQIVVPPHLTEQPSTSVDGSSRKIQISESSLSEEYEVSRPKKVKKKEEPKDCSKENEVNSVRTAKGSDVKGPFPSEKFDAGKIMSLLKGLSQDSGIGSSSSQEFATNLCLDQIVVPTRLTEQPSTSVDETSRKRQISESSLSEEYEVSRPKKVKKKEEPKDCSKENEVNSVRTGEGSDVKGPLPECKEICMMCNLKPKNSVFLHGRIAHMCCCYGCAMRTWKSMKRCPICKRQVSNVVRVFTT